MPIDISALARSSGLPASTLRFYEEKGLIQSIGRHGLRRVFDDDTPERLSLIALGRIAGFSLDEICTMFGPDGALRIDRTRLSEKAEELDTRIADLSALRDGLRHAANCPAPNHMACSTFRRMVKRAGTAQARGLSLPTAGRLAF